MTHEEREATEAKAERSLRRGELSDAFALFTQLTQAFPTDEGLARRVEDLKESLQPAELSSGKANFRAESTTPSSPADDAEVRAAKGDYAGAISLYRKLLSERPDSDLVKERLAELFQLAQAGRAPPKPQALPAKPLDAVLSELLARISARRR